MGYWGCADQALQWLCTGLTILIGAFVQQRMNAKKARPIVERAF